MLRNYLKKKHSWTEIKHAIDFDLTNALKIDPHVHTYSALPKDKNTMGIITQKKTQKN